MVVGEGKTRVRVFLVIEMHFGHSRVTHLSSFEDVGPHSDGKRAQVNATRPHVCILATYMRMICIADDGHKVDEMTTRGASGANFAPVRSYTR